MDIKRAQILINNHKKYLTETYITKWYTSPFPPPELIYLSTTSISDGEKYDLNKKKHTWRCIISYKKHINENQ